MNRNIAIIGAGLIGQSWAITFARAGYNAALFDTQAGAVEAAHEQIARSCGSLEELDLLSGQNGSEVCARIRSAASMEDAVDGVCYVQENTPENVEVKRGIFADLDRATPQGCGDRQLDLCVDAIAVHRRIGGRTPLFGGASSEPAASDPGCGIGTRSIDVF